MNRRVNWVLDLSALENLCVRKFVRQDYATRRAQWPFTILFSSDHPTEHMDDAIPAELTEGAIRRDREYAWELSALPIALQRAPNLGYACLGGAVLVPASGWVGVRALLARG